MQNIHELHEKVGIAYDQRSGIDTRLNTIFFDLEHMADVIGWRD